MDDISRIPRSFAYALKGLRHAYRADKSFRLEIRLGIPIYLAVGWILAPITPLELLFLLLSYFLILTVELMNTAFEKMLDKVHPEQHEMIGRSKDIASAAVLMTFIFAAIVITNLLCEHFFLHSSFSVLGGFA